MKKTFAVLLGAMLLLTSFTFVACDKDPFDDGGNTNPWEFTWEDDGTNTAGHDGVDENGNPLPKTTLNVVVLADQMERNLMSSFKKAFEEHDKRVTINFTTFPGDYQQAMTTYVAGGQNAMPDVLWTGGEQHIPWSSSGWFLDLSERFENDDEISLSDYYPSMIAATHYSDTDTGIWFAPRDYNKPVTFINKEIFAAAGIPVPKESEWNMAKFEEVCRQLRAAMDANTDPAKAAVGLTGTSYPVDAQFAFKAVYYSFIKQFGGEIVDKTAKTIEVDDASMIEVGKQLYPFFRDRLMSNPNTSSYTFGKKGAAMWFQVRPHVPEVLAADIDLDFLPMPTDYVGAGCGGYAISSAAASRPSAIEGVTKADLAWEFVKWIMRGEGQSLYGYTGMGVPVLMSQATKGAWIDYNEPSRNHAAFTSRPERDFDLNIFNCFDPANSLTLFNTVDGLCLELTLDANYKDTPVGNPAGTQEYTKLQARLNTLAKNLRRYAISA